MEAEAKINSDETLDIANYLSKQDEKWDPAYGAPEEDIVDAERALGLTFPESYRRFLQVSNGGETTDAPNLVSFYNLTRVLESSMNHPLLQEHLPGMVFFADDYGDYIFYFDVKGSLGKGTWAIFGQDHDSLSWYNSQFIEKNFDSFIKRVFEGPRFDK